VNGQAEIAGLPDGLLDQFSKRAEEIGVEMGDKLADFQAREGRDPSTFEDAAMEREAAVDTRNRKTGLGVTDLRTRWQAEALSLGIDPAILLESVAEHADQHPLRVSLVAVGEVVEALAAKQSAWNRTDVLRQLCGTVSPQPGHDATTWAMALDAAVDTVLAECVDLDPTDTGAHRLSDGRSVWIEPIAKQSTSEHVLAQEEHIVTFALKEQAIARTTPPTTTPGRNRAPDTLLAFLDSLQLCRVNHTEARPPQAPHPPARHKRVLGITQKCAHRGGRHDFERQHRLGRSGTQHVDMIDVGRTGDHRGDQGADLAAGYERSGVDPLVRQAFQTKP